MKGNRIPSYYKGIRYGYEARKSLKTLNSMLELQYQEQLLQKAIY